MAAIPTRSGRLKRLLAKPWPYDILNALLGMAAACVAAFKFFRDGQSALGVLAIGIALLVATVAITKAVVQWNVSKREESVHELEGCLETLRAILLQGVKETDPNPDLRLTVHVPVPGRAELEQAVDYVGSTRWPGTAGRTFSAECGVIGKAFREKEAKVWQRQNDNYERYVDELVKVWSYNAEAARKVDKSRVAGMAIPITDEADHVVGVLYMDVLERDFFTDDRKADAIYATSGIASYIRRRYK